MGNNVRTRQVEVGLLELDDDDFCVDCAQQIVWVKRKTEWGWYDGKCGCQKRQWVRSPVTVKVERIDG
jgi:hypothetical protein